MDDFMRRYWEPIPSARHRPARPQRSPPQPRKVISIPVTDGNRTPQPTPVVRAPALPTESLRLAAALKIQKALRGFLIRKSMRTVRDVQRQVQDIERRVERSFDAIAKDEKERLKINEMLMALLFKLDSVRGVRDYRKKVIRRAIAIQEMLDAISNDKVDEETEKNDDPVPDVGVELSMTQKEEKEKEEEVSGDQMEPSEEDAGGHGPVETARDVEKKYDCDMEAESAMTQEEGSSGDQMEPSEEDMGVRDIKSGRRVEGEGMEAKGVVERMAEDNERLRGMVAELLDRSAEQSKLMSGLASRVEELERKVGKFGRMKKKQCTGNRKAVLRADRYWL